MFDSWKQANDPELRDWGMHLSDDRKGTLVEALIWRRYGPRILSDRAREELASLVTLLATSPGND